MSQQIKPIRFYVYACIAASVLLLSSILTAQNTQQVPVPVNHLYWHFLLLQNHLDRVAAVREQQGEDGSALRNYYRERLGFSEPQFAVVRGAGLQLEPELQAIDAQVKAVIDADRARHSKVLANRGELPPLPPELVALQQRREAAIDTAVSRLKAALGEPDTARLQTFLTKEFVHNVTARRVAVPHPHSDPAQHRVPPFPQEAQR